MPTNLPLAVSISTADRKWTSNNEVTFISHPTTPSIINTKSLLLLPAFLCAFLQVVWSQVSYIHRSWDGTKVVEEEKQSPYLKTFDIAEYGSEDGMTMMFGDWFVVSGNVTKKNITVTFICPTTPQKASNIWPVTLSA